MKRWIALAAELYPSSWRAEYGEEFRALLEDVKPGWRVFANVLRGAVTMQLSKGTHWLKLTAATAVTGLLVAAALSFNVAPRYVSTAVIQVAPQPDPLRPATPDVLHQRAADRVLGMQTNILSRTALFEIISDPALDLYKDDRRRMPMADVVEQMRHDIRIETLPSSAFASSPIVFRVSFAYPDRAKAQAAVDKLVTKFSDQNLMANRTHRALYEYFWRDQVAAHHAASAPPPPVGETLTVIESPTLPQKSEDRNRAPFLAVGFAAGLVLGLLAAVARSRPRGVRLLAGFAAAGLVVAAGGSYLIPDRYTSTAVMRVTPVQVTENPFDTPALTGAAEHIRQLQSEVLSRENLARIIKSPSLDLYHLERTTKSFDDIINSMRDRDIRMAHQGVSAFSISFSYPDPLKAQAVTRELVTSFVELNIRHARANAAQQSVVFREIEQHKAGENLEVLDPASLPESPVAPNRLLIAAAGLALGLLLGVCGIGLRPVQPSEART